MNYLQNFKLLLLFILSHYLPVSFAANMTEQQDIIKIIEQIDLEADAYLQGQSTRIIVTRTKPITTVPIKNIPPKNKPKETQRITKSEISNKLSKEFEEISILLHQWASLWSKGKVNEFINFYTKNYSPSRKSHKQWVKNRKKRIKPEKKIKVEISEITFKILRAKQKIRTQFKQRYSSIHYSDTSKKQIIWKKINGKWLISSEKSIK